MQLDLQVKAREAHEKAVAYFKVAEQYSYQFIMEVKEIRDKQYYKALGYSSFDEYCQSCWKVVREYMDQRILIAESFGSEWNFENTYSQLGHSKSLILARMEPEIREEVMTKPQRLPDGTEKTASEMTVKQLKELERRLKQTEDRAKEAEARAERAENEAHHWQSVAKAAQNRPPVVQTQTVEVIPPDYQQTKELANRLNTENAQLKRDMMEMRHKYEEQLTAEDHKREARRNLKKACETLLQDISTYTSTILFNYKLIQGDREAYQFLEAFGQQYNMRMQEFFGELKNLTQLRAIK
mgnify:CR=1 FL=1